MIINLNLFVRISAVIVIDLFTKVNSLLFEKKKNCHATWNEFSFQWMAMLRNKETELHDPHRSPPFQCDHGHYDAVSVLLHELCYILCLIKINYFYGWWYPWKYLEFTLSTSLTSLTTISMKICSNFISRRTHKCPFSAMILPLLIHSLTYGTEILKKKKS